MLFKATKVLLKTALFIFRDAKTVGSGMWSNYIPSKPRILQFPITDICNSRCVMCEVWKNKKEHEISAEQIAKALEDPLFSKIAYVGLNGGEPTLRPDLEEVAQSLVESLPKLTMVGIITNCLRPEQVIERIRAINKVFRSAGVQFNVMLSLDGIGDIHDTVRGVKGNFQSALQVFESLRLESIRLSIGATITPLNVWWADDILLWGKEKDVEVSIKPASVIARLKNESYAQNYPYTEEQIFHMTLFFDKMSRRSGGSANSRATYRSMSGQIAGTGDRRVGCFWQTNRGVTLDSHGNISYCSVASPILGSAISESAWKIFRSNFSKRRQIKRERCSSCYHLMGPIGLRDSIELHTEALRNKFARQFRRFHGSPLFRKPAQWFPPRLKSPRDWKRVLIVGWWGTETAGDKAIIAELLQVLKQQAPDCRISVSTLQAIVSQQTARELDCDFERHVALADCAKASVIRAYDAVIIGGGPLMDIPQLRFIREAFRLGAKNGAARVIFGCGVGPLNNPFLLQVAEDICKLATSGFFRDSESLSFTSDLDCQATFQYACDPALAYVTSKRSTHSLDLTNSPIITLLRENTAEYQHAESREKLLARNQEVARHFGEALVHLVGESGPKAELLAMHALGVGGDDRLYARSIESVAALPERIVARREYFTITDLIDKIASAQCAVAMRYHAHLFCLALGVPFVSINYTGTDGKVSRLVKRLSGVVPSLEWDTLDAHQVEKAIRQIIEDAPQIRAGLLASRDKLLKDLNRACSEAFVMPRERQ